MNPGARRFARHVPAVAAIVTSSWTAKSSSSSKCEAPPKKSFGMVPDAEGDFHNMFPMRQLWQPKVEYPLWDANWDYKKPTPTGNEEEDRNRMRQLRKEGVTRHIILIRHGQYDETEKEDEKRLLTELGRKQADLTGRRLKEMMDGASKEFGPCKIKVVRVSNMARAKETADIIAAHLPGVPRSEPEPNLNEGRPAHNVPGGKASPGTIEKTDENHPRIEEAFRQLFYRAPPPDEKKGEDEPLHEFEIVVCHANVVRYFLCR
jgi:serine/threonine-protein phosphatase PGAM5